MSIDPDFQRLRTMLLRGGEPDRVPLVEVGVHAMLKESVLGRPVKSLEDEVEFWVKAGYDHVPLQQGLQETDLIKRQSMHDIESNYATGTTDTQHRQWATEGKGIVTNRAEFEALRLPDPDALDYSEFDRVSAFLPSKMKVTAVLGKVFSSVWWLMGLEGFAMATKDDPDLLARMFEKVGQFQYRVFENMLKFDCVGMLWHADDIAFATQLMVNPQILRKHLFPWYKEMNRVAHEHGRLAVYHSDGAVQQVMEDIIDCGFDGLNPIEPKAMDINEVKAKYGTRISLMGNIDLIYTLTRGTPEEVRDEVRQRIHDLAPGGGYGVASANSIPEYVLPANYDAMREAVFEYGRYPISV